MIISQFFYYASINFKKMLNLQGFSIKFRLKYWLCNFYGKKWVEM